MVVEIICCIFMKKICIVEKDKILRDYFSNYYKKRFVVSFVSLEEIKKVFTESFSSYNKFIVDISGIDNYVDLCSELFGKYLVDRKLIFLVGKEQKKKLQNLGLKTDRMVSPESVNDLELFLTV
ncbi:MAG: hypothetical protein CR982_10235 [Candidatus Cloacimonadota bacterium]|nr:MAG: hypothetical protein CR982_10235 [Candidatus Cloacimonadota bacterium]PIE77547.1 MAG: hypothetical protein CSA15_12290 [Candidatus Delongbacteria bacterium]